ncbi:MAG TPA: M48 family metalloprotease, partial [Quisquiliibacterium sp.]|nr:M48 family metalloprotease [Quisquiliibacterium sp.]
MHALLEPGSARRPARRRRRAACAALAIALAVVPPAAIPQANNLPRLGDAAAEDLSPAAERRLGERIMRDIRRDAAVSDDVELAGYLNSLAAALTASAQGHSFELFLVKDPTMNAFALPGGFIGVHTGLIIAAETESELASVIAHEIGHVTQRHIARMLSDQRQTTLGTLASLVLAALAARSSPQAAIGIVTMASGAQQQQMLAFSRDAEREADRVGMDTLRASGFDPNGMVAFFGRLQQSSRTYESTAPAYMRSHPMTVERIADMQARVQEGRYRQHPDSIEFRLARARLRALGDGSVDALRAERRRFERLLREKTTNDETAAWFGLAVATAAQRDFPAARQAIDETRSRLPEGHPYVERLAAQVALVSGDAQGALKIAQE